MDNYEFVRPEFLNHYGYLFGGQMLKWIDECAWITASVEFPHCRFVTIGIDRAEFRHPVPDGSLLRFNTQLQRRGKTSVTYTVEVYGTAPQKIKENFVFSTAVTLVAVDKKGHKHEIDEAMN